MIKILKYGPKFLGLVLILIYGYKWSSLDFTELDSYQKLVCHGINLIFGMLLIIDMKDN